MKLITVGRNKLTYLFKEARIVFSQDLSSWTKPSIDNGFYPVKKMIYPALVQQTSKDLQQASSKSRRGGLLSFDSLIPRVQQKPCPKSLELSSSGSINNILLPGLGFGRLGQSLPVAILDPAVKRVYDCPDVSPTSEIVDPLPSSGRDVQDLPAADRATEKLALNIMQRRRKKMKKHQYKRQRKRNFHLIIAQNIRKKKKKEKLFKAKLESIRFKHLESSDIEEYITKREEEKEINSKYLDWESKMKSEGKFIRKKIIYR